MSLKIKFTDISKIKSDALVNSVGVGHDVIWYGKVCESILRGAASRELISLIHSWKDEAEIGKFFITDGYNLPSKHIIHVVTPYYNDDNDLNKLETTYKIILIIAHKNKWNNVTLPLIGTGANGYPHSIVFKMVVNLVSAFSILHKAMNITICAPLIVDHSIHEAFNDDDIKQLIESYFSENFAFDTKVFGYRKEDFEFLESFTVDELITGSSSLIQNPPKNIRSENKINNVTSRRVHQLSLLDKRRTHLKSNTKEYLNQLFTRDVRSVLIDMMNLPILSITCFIDTYIDAKYENDSDRKIIKKYVNEIVSGDINSTSLRTKHNIEEKRTTVTLPMLMRYILALRMSLEEANQLLCFCGRTFSPISKRDCIYKEIIIRGIYDVYLVNGLCLKANIEQIFGYDKVEYYELDTSR